MENSMGGHQVQKVYAENTAEISHFTQNPPGSPYKLTLLQISLIREKHLYLKKSNFSVTSSPTFLI